MNIRSEADIDNLTVTKAYARWAPVYDLVFGPVFERGREAAVAAAERIGGRILEVGVGTGISLPHYSGNCRLCGVDISAPMLRKAQERNLLGGTIEDHIQRTPVRRVGRPEDIAATCAFLISEEAGYITGQILGVNGGRNT